MSSAETYDDAISDLEEIAARYERRAEGCGPSRDDQRDRARYIAQAEALRAAADELREGAEDELVEDVGDVTTSVLDLTEYLRTRFDPLPVPTHPRAGWTQVGSAEGRPGHCSVCVVVGHEVAHPERGCADVGCDGSHGAVEDEVRVVHTYDGLGVDQIGFDPASTLITPQFR